MIYSFALGKAQFPREERQTVNVDQLTMLETELERVTQKLHDSEIKLTEMQDHVKTSQTQTIDMIKESKLSKRK